VKPSKELSIGLLQTLLARPPKLEELLDYAVKEVELGADYLARLPGFRSYLLSLLEVRSYEDADRVLYEALSTELHTLERFLPENYLEFLKKFLELYYIDYVSLSLVKAPGETSDFAKASLVKLAGGTSLSSVAAEYSGCTSRDVRCILMRYLERVRSSYTKLREAESRALDAVRTLVAVRYFNYYRNAELLGLKLGEFERVVAEIGINPVVEVSLRKVLDRLERLERAELTRYTVHEASVTYPLMKELLAYSGGLANVLTLYLANRYYELKVLRYSLLPKSLRRW